MYCSFGRGHRTPHSTGGRDLPIYTAGLTGAMRVYSSLLKETTLTATATDGTMPMLKPQSHTASLESRTYKFCIARHFCHRLSIGDYK